MKYQLHSKSKATSTSTEVLTLCCDMNIYRNQKTVAIKLTRAEMRERSFGGARDMHCGLGQQRSLESVLAVRNMAPDIWLRPQPEEVGQVSIIGSLIGVS